MILLLASALAAGLDLNQASVDQLDALPGLGRAKATAIVDHRNVHGPFRTWEDVYAVSGLGPATVRLLRMRVRLSGPVLAMSPSSPRADEARLPVVPSASMLDPNTASAAELVGWPGITGARAEAIVAARKLEPFERCADLVRAHGVGPATVAGLRGLCVIRGTSYTPP